jgi:hypothetical protein
VRLVARRWGRIVNISTGAAKYPAAMLAELLDAGEITKDQYDRLRMERA